MIDLPKSFVNYLTASLTVSEKTLKNYISDFSHFTGWAILRLRTDGFEVSEESDILPHLSPEFLTRYRDFLTSNKVPPSTINRRLSTLRHLGRFLATRELTDANIAKDISNMSSLNLEEKMLEGFKKHLEKEGTKEKTVKNYISDVRGFLAFITESAEY